MRALGFAMALALLASGCGGMAAGPASSAEGSAITGVYVRRAAERPNRATPAANVRIELFRRQVLTAGPLLQKAPEPVRVTRTDARGRFSFENVSDRRWFVVARDPEAYTTGRWATTERAVRLFGCTDCPRPY
jgi:hypothetical protein